MLISLRADNFRSLINVEFVPAGLNLLLGPNNAGKTNLCSALRFLSLSAGMTLDSAAQTTFGETWNVRNMYVDRGQISLEVRCQLSYADQKLDFIYRLVLDSPRQKEVSRPPLRLAEESLIVDGGCFQKTKLLDNKLGQARMLHEEGFVSRRDNSPFYVETLAGNEATMLSQLYELRDNPRATLFKKYLRSWMYFNFSPDALRASEVLRDHRFLRHDGANLSRVLCDMHNEKPRLERKLLMMVKTLEPKLDLFSFATPDPEHVYLFLEDEKANRFGARSISDGTMRFLGMACVLLAAQEMGSETGGPPLVIIEEPENGLYVGHLKPLLQGIDPTGRGGQFIFTSHSPYFMDLFDANLDGVFVVKPGLPSSRLVKPEADHVRRLLHDMSLGEMHFRELLA